MSIITEANKIVFRGCGLVAGSLVGYYLGGGVNSTVAGLATGLIIAKMAEIASKRFQKKEEISEQLQAAIRVRTGESMIAALDRQLGELKETMSPKDLAIADALIKSLLEPTGSK